MLVFDKSLYLKTRGHQDEYAYLNQMGGHNYIDDCDGAVVDFTDDYGVMKAVRNSDHHGNCVYFTREQYCRFVPSLNCGHCGKEIPKAEALTIRDCYGIFFKYVCEDCYDKPEAQPRDYSGDGLSDYEIWGEDD